MNIEGMNIEGNGGKVSVLYVGSKSVGCTCMLLHEQACLMRGNGYLVPAKLEFFAVQMLRP